MFLRLCTTKLFTTETEYFMCILHICFNEMIISPTLIAQAETN